MSTKLIPSFRLGSRVLMSVKSEEFMMRALGVTEMPC